MRNVLNNPKVVGALCVVALVMVYFRLFDSKPNFNPPIQRVEAQEASIEAPVATPSGELQPVPPATEPSPIASMDMEWPEAIERDPFQKRFMVRTLHDSGDRPAEETEGNLAETEPTLQLHAVFLDGSRKMAMINRQLVKEGEQVEGYVVQRIQRDLVQLQGKEGVRLLKFGLSTNDQDDESSEFSG